MIQKYTFTGGGGWLDQGGLKLTQSPAKAGVEVGTWQYFGKEAF